MWKLAILLLIALSRAYAADMLIWMFDSSLDGWQPGNWATVEARDGAIVGTTKYDSQLLSPVLSVEAKDYAELVVRVKSSLQGRGEVFFNAPKERMSDKKKASHVLPAAGEYVMHRIKLAGTPGWEGTVERLRFDPLNPGDAKVRIDFIALVPADQGLLINGGAEMLVDGKPLEWTSGPDAKRAGVVTESPHSGKRAFRLRNGGWWETPEVDYSFLNTIRVTAYARCIKGRRLKWELMFGDGEGRWRVHTSSPLLGHFAEWREFGYVHDRSNACRWATRFKLRFTAPQGDCAWELDDVRLILGERGSIRADMDRRSPWSAEWIWHPSMLDRDHVRVYLRHRFDLPAGAIKSAVLQLTADDGYSLKVNGSELHRTFGEADGWRTPEVLDMRPALKAGRNEIRVVAEDAASAQGFIALGAVVFADGDQTIIRTSSRWEAAVSPEGDWVSAESLGTPPCLPWGDLPYKPVGAPVPVALRVADVKTETAAPGALAYTLSCQASHRARLPVFVTTWIERDGNVLCREGGPWLLLQEGQLADDARRYSKTISLPYGISPGPATLRFGLINGVFDGPEPWATIQVKAKEMTREFPRAEVKTADGLARLYVNDDEVCPTQALFTRPDPMHQQNAKAAGVHVWGISLRDMGFKEDGFDYSDVDATIERYLQTDPNAWLILNFLFDTRYQRWWIKAHPEARCRLEDGSDVVGGYHGTRAQFPSTCSPVWRETFGDVVRRLIRHLKQSPYASRIIGFQPCAGISAEWFHWGAQSRDLVDYSPAGQADFRRWLRRKYGTDAALQKAWRRPKVTLAAAAVPAGESRRTPNHGMFYDLATQQDVLDYHRYQHDVVADAILYLYRIIKEETDGRSLCGTYYGYAMHLPETPGFCQSSGHFSLHKHLRSPAVDYAIAPTGYAWREVGGAAASMTTPGSFPIHGKLWWDQADLRSHWSHQAGHGRPKGLRGSIQCMRREVARSLAQGNAVQWYDFSHGWTFGDERLTQEMGRLQDAIKTRRTAKDWPRSKYLAVIVGETQIDAVDLFNPAYGLALIYRQREQLNRAGVPWRAYLFSDLLAKPELLEHRAFLLLNLFKLTKAQRAFLRDTLMRDGRTVALVGPVGYAHAKGFDAGLTGKLLGWPMKSHMEPARLLAKVAGELPRPWASCAGKEFGTGKAFAPVLLPEGQAGHVLGTLKDSGRPAVILDERRDVRLFWSAAPGLPPEVLRALALSAGLPVACDSNDALYVGHGYIGIHARAPGKRTIKLVAPSSARDLISGKTWPAGTREVELDMSAGETAILLCER